MTLAQAILSLAVVVLTAAALLAVYRLAKGPTGLDRAVASDVLVAVLIASLAVYSVWNATPVVEVIILVLSMVGFTAAVAMARMVTGATDRERRYVEAEARRAYGHESADTDGPGEGA